MASGKPASTSLSPSTPVTPASCTSRSPIEITLSPGRGPSSRLPSRRSAGHTPARSSLTPPPPSKWRTRLATLSMKNRS
jgi:hypothetical protein